MSNKPQDYTAYLERGGAKGLGEYRALRDAAESYIAYYTCGRYPNRIAADNTGAFSGAESALAEIVSLLEAHGGATDVQSISNNGINVTFRSDMKLSGAIRNIVIRHLSAFKDVDGVPLCYRGME